MSPNSSTTSAKGADAPEPASRMSIRRRLFFAIVLLAVVLACAIIAAEIGLRLFADVTDMPLYMWDPVVGVRRAPDQSGIYIRGEHIQAPYHFNSAGWNHPNEYQPAKPPGTQRICVVGDSYVEALQVHPEQAFFSVAEQKMRNDGLEVQWYAFGCSGFGTSHASFVIRHYVLDYHPDVVIILFVQNDPVDCSPFLARQEPFSPILKLDDDGQLVRTTARQFHPKTLKRWFLKSSLVRYLRYHMNRPRQSHGYLARSRIPLRQGIAESTKTQEQTTEKLHERQENTWRLIEAILRDTRELCQSRGAQLALAFRGSSAAIGAAETNETYIPPPESVDPYCLDQRIDEMGKERLEPMARRLRIPYLDLTEPIIEEVTRTGLRHDFPDDAHYGPVGHKAAGQALADWTRQLLDSRHQNPRANELEE